MARQVLGFVIDISNSCSYGLVYASNGWAKHINRRTGVAQRNVMIIRGENQFSQHHGYFSRSCG